MNSVIFLLNTSFKHTQTLLQFTECNPIPGICKRHSQCSSNYQGSIHYHFLWISSDKGLPLDVLITCLLSLCLFSLNSSSPPPTSLVKREPTGSQPITKKISFVYSTFFHTHAASSSHIFLSLKFYSPVPAYKCLRKNKFQVLSSPSWSMESANVPSELLHSPHFSSL